jgi:cysteinyl-tRNA synthetase
MLNIRSEKMSKSLGNIVTIRDVLNRFPGAAVRYFILSTHYRKILEFSMDLVGDAAKGWQRLQNTAAEIEAYLWALGWRKPAKKAAGEPSALETATADARQRFFEAMDDDFNTAQAIGVLFDLENSIVAQTTVMDFGSVTREQLDALGSAVATLFELGKVLGLIERPRFAPGSILKKLGVIPGDGESPASALRHTVNALVTQRMIAKQQKAWDVADSIRKQLTEAGIKLEDTKTGYRWRPEV